MIIGKNRFFIEICELQSDLSPIQIYQGNFLKVIHFFYHLGVGCCQKNNFFQSTVFLHGWRERKPKFFATIFMGKELGIFHSILNRIKKLSHRKLTCLTNRYLALFSLNEWRLVVPALLIVTHKHCATR